MEELPLLKQFFLKDSGFVPWARILTGIKKKAALVLTKLDFQKTCLSVTTDSICSINFSIQSFRLLSFLRLINCQVGSLHQKPDSPETPENAKIIDRTPYLNSFFS